MSGSAGGWDGQLSELYAASCVYLSDPDRAERLLRKVLQAGHDPSAPTPDRPTLHRAVYRAAVDAGARSAPPRSDGSRLERALALLPLRTRASVFLVDTCGLRYADVARVLGVATDGIGTTVATGRRRLAAVVVDAGIQPSEITRPSTSVRQRSWCRL